MKAMSEQIEAELERLAALSRELHEISVSGFEQVLMEHRKQAHKVLVMVFEDQDNEGAVF